MVPSYKVARVTQRPRVLSKFVEQEADCSFGIDGSVGCLESGGPWPQAKFERVYRELIFVTLLQL